MRVLVLANNDMGLYKFRKELLDEMLHPGSYLADRKTEPYEVYIASPFGEFIPEMEKMGCKFIHAPLERHGTNLFREVKLLFLYREIIKVVRPDVVLTYTIKPNLYGGITCRMAKVPYIMNITGLGTAMENGGMLQKILLGLYRMVLPKAACVFFQNESNMAFFQRRGLFKSRYRLIPGSGVNTERFGFVLYPQEADSFLFIGRLMKAKGIEEFFSAAKRIKEKYPHALFEVVGGADEDYSEQLERLQSKGILQYRGAQRDVRPFIEKASAIVLPSYHEGMANVLLEASAMGRPVLASDIPGCRETFDEGVSGFGFAPKSAEALYEAMEKFLALPHEEKEAMGKAGRAKMEREFDRKIVVDAYMEELNLL